MELLCAIDNMDLYRKAVKRIREENMPYHAWEDLRSKYSRDRDFIVVVDGNMVGTISYQTSTSSGACSGCHRSPVDISYFIFKEFRGRGYASRAVGLFIQRFSVDVGACVSVKNPASLAVLVKNGFEKLSKSEVPCLKGKVKRERAYRLIKKCGVSLAENN